MVAVDDEKGDDGKEVLEGPDDGDLLGRDRVDDVDDAEADVDADDLSGELHGIEDEPRDEAEEHAEDELLDDEDDVGEEVGLRLDGDREHPEEGDGDDERQAGLGLTDDGPVPENGADGEDSDDAHEEKQEDLPPGDAEVEPCGVHRRRPAVTPPVRGCASSGRA